VGGGAGGCSIAAKYASKLGKNRVIVIDPADVSYCISCISYCINQIIMRIIHQNKYL
jgi:NAD-dependent dihydropyrimidine dehydrogenase PreA subunit